MTAKEIKIIPAILARNKKELDEKLAKVFDLVTRVQIDITQKPFVDNESIQIKDLKNLNTEGLFVELHLMVAEPERILEEVAKVCNMAIVHIEVCGSLRAIINKAHLLGLKIGLALNPETKSSVLEDSILDMLSADDMVLIMGVNPGASGRKFMREVLPKIQELRKRKPDLIIGADGGMKPDNVGEVVKAGAYFIYAGSAILEESDAGKAIETFRKNAN